MEMSRRAGSGGDEQDNQSSRKGRRRHGSEKTARLEEIFKEIKHPDEHLRQEIGKEVGLDPRQVKFWFQNRRTHKKIQEKKAINSTLRLENERILNENVLLAEVLKNTHCSSCEGPPPRNHIEQQHSMTQLQRLQLENAFLKEEYKRVSNLLARCKADQKTWTAPQFRRLDPPMGSLYVGSSSTCPKSVSDENLLLHSMEKRSQLEKAIKLEAGMAAKEELIKLLSTDEPLWVKSQTDCTLSLDDKNYSRVFPTVNHFFGAKARVESSKDSRIVKIKATQLVEMLLDSEKWSNLFPTIVTKAQTIEVLEKGSPENRSGALLLMYEKMHVLSPLLPSREFYFLRYCDQVGAGIWVITDVSYDYLKEYKPHFCTWKFPSGCMIQQISSTSSHVSWVEHVEVEDNIQTHSLYRDLVNSTVAFGAQRWLMELERMGERFYSATIEYIPIHDSGVITLPEGRKSVMQLSHRMVKSFCEILTMSSKMNFPEYLIENDNNAVRYSIRKATNRYPKGMMIITFATSLSLPLHTQTLFNFFRDPQKRFQWDALCHGNPWKEIAHILSGPHPNNCISIIEPIKPPHPNGTMIIQESFTDRLGSFVVYSPVKIPELRIAINGQDSSDVLVLPSGIVILEDSQSLFNAPISISSGNGGKKKRGSLLTIAFQVLMPGPEAVNLASVSAVNTLMTSTIENIKSTLLNDPELE